MQNIPKIKVGVVAVSRDCFPESLSVGRRKALISAYHRLFGKDADIYECPRAATRCACIWAISDPR